MAISHRFEQVQIYTMYAGGLTMHEQSARVPLRLSSPEAGVVAQSMALAAATPAIMSSPIIRAAQMRGSVDP